MAGPNLNYWQLKDPGYKPRDKVMMASEIIIEPENYNKALCREDKQLWVDAMKTEIEQHE